jgi:hypothetical protein
LRRAQIDDYSQTVRNLATNPLFETANGTVTTHTNLAQSPSFETTSGTVDVRTNLFTNPLFQDTNGTLEVRRNWIPNPSFEGTSGTTNVRTNLCTYPSFEVSAGTATIRTNLATNTRGTYASPDYSGAGNQTITGNVAITGHPDGITTAQRVTFAGGAANPGITILSPLTSGWQYTASAWVYHETNGGGSQGLAQAGVASGSAPGITTGVWQRISWTFTASGTSQLGFRVSAPSAAGSFLITGLLVELRPDLAQFFDGATATPTNLAKTSATALSGVTLTTNVSYAGATWTRASVGVGSSGLITRQYVALTDLGAGGKTYTTSVTVANDQAFSQTISLDWCDTGNPTFTLAPGEQRRITLSSSRATYDATFRFSDLTINQSTTEGRSILYKDWLIEEGTSSGYYYATTGDFTYSWSGTANASTSFQKAPALAGWLNASNAVSYQTVADPVIGSKASAVTTKGANGDGFYFSDVAITAGKNYVMSIWIKLTSTLPSFSGILRWKDSGGAILSESGFDVYSTLVVGSWTRVSVTGVAPASATTLQPMWRVYALHTPTTFYADGCLLTEGSVDQPYFDGSTAAAGDFTYAWAGTAHSSLSYQQAPGIGSWANRWFGSTGGSGVLYQAKGGLSGTYARKLWIQPNTGASMDVGISLQSKIAVNPNTPYTLSAWVRSSVTQSFNPFLEWRDSGNAVISTSRDGVPTSLVANTWTRISITATSPATASTVDAMVSTYNNAQPMPSGATLDFDNVLFEATPIVNDYFDAVNTIRNMESNPSFETATGWTAAALNSGFGRTQTRSYSGTYSVFGVAVDNLGDSMYTNTVPYTVEPGATYTLSAYAWVPTGVVATDFRDAARNLWAVAAASGVPSLVTRGYLDFTKTNQWQRVSTTITIPSGSTQLNIRLYFPANASGLYWDSVLVEKSANLNPYYEGTGDFTYSWAGTTNASASIQQATKATGVGYANQAATFRTGYAGNYKARTIFTSNTIGDSGVNFSSGISISPSKTYTISMDLTSDTARSVKFSAQGSGTVISGTAPISIPAGTTRLSWTFSTSDTAPTNTALYLLRADLLMGTLDMSKVLVEEGSYQIGGYFDGTKTEQNLITNSNFETDTSGWAANTGAPTISSSTDRPYLGTKSLKISGTTTSTDIAVATTNSIVLKPSTTYTVSYYVYSMDARTACYVDVAAPNLNLNRVGSKSVPASTWTRISGTFTTPDTVNGSANLYLHHAGGPATIGSTVYVDCVLLEESNTLNQYYEGSSDFTYAWTGVAHASTSVQRGTAVSRVNSERSYGISTTRNGDKVVRVIPATKGNGQTPYIGTDVFINLASQPVQLKAYTTYTLVSTIILESPLSSGIAKWRVNIDGLDQYSPVFPNTVGEWTQYWQFNTGSNASIAFFRFMPGPSGVPGYTNEVILKNVMIVEGPYSGKYFDGTTPAEIDFSYFWTGTAHGSTSYRRGTGVSGYTTGNSLAVQSSEWSASGSKSIRITPTTQFSTSSLIISSPILEKGKTYTVLATRRLTAPLTGTLSAYAGAIISVQTGIGTYYSPFLPNVAGVAQARLVFKYDENAGASTLRLGHGGAEGSGDVWWDNLTIVEGEYLGDHISGDNPYSKWEGTAKASTAIGYPQQFLDIAGKPTREQIGVGTLANTNPAPDMGPRTIYIVYQTFGYASAYQNPGYYGLTTTGRVAVQTQNSGQNQMGVRIDFPGGEFNRVLVMQNGTRTPGVHVIAITVEDGCTVARTCCDGGTDVVATGINPGSGWSGDQMAVSVAQSETAGVRTIVFNAQHDRATRIALSRYLGNKYGANVA